MAPTPARALHSGTPWAPLRSPPRHGLASRSTGQSPAAIAILSSLDGWHVQHRVEGRHPDGSARDSAAVRSALRAIHSATTGWPQRPGSRSAAELLTADLGADVDLGALPDTLRSVVRAAWSAFDPQGRCVVHGDAGGGNALLLPDGRCVLIDWDEARVDDPVFDLADPDDPTQARAALAWEIATCWVTEPDYARSLVPRLLP